MQKQKVQMLILLPTTRYIQKIKILHLSHKVLQKFSNRNAKIKISIIWMIIQFLLSLKKAFISSTINSNGNIWMQSKQNLKLSKDKRKIRKRRFLKIKEEKGKNLGNSKNNPRKNNNQKTIFLEVQ